MIRALSRFLQSRKDRRERRATVALAGEVWRTAKARHDARHPQDYRGKHDDHEAMMKALHVVLAGGQR